MSKRLTPGVLKKGLSALVLMWGLTSMPWADSSTDSDPEQIVRHTTQTILDALRADPEIYRQDRQKLMELVDRVLMPSLDFSLTSRLALGQHWRKASRQQRMEFERLFREMLLRTYTAPLLEYAADVNFAFPPGGQQQDDKRATVRTVLSFSGSEAVPVHYAMRHKDDGWKVYDVVIGGISAVMTFRSSFGEQINQRGMDQFLKKLAARNAELVEKDKAEQQTLK